MRGLRCVLVHSSTGNEIEYSMSLGGMVAISLYLNCAIPLVAPDYSVVKLKCNNLDPYLQKTRVIQLLIESAFSNRERSTIFIFSRSNVIMFNG